MVLLLFAFATVSMFGGMIVQVAKGLRLIDVPVYPVSYTHLRAHETVLDLVCRLLLEKKKNQRHNSI